LGDGLAETERFSPKPEMAVADVDLGRIRAKDVLLVLSNSGETAEIKALVDWPDGYYVEIHTIVFQQNGAVRGQTVPESGGAAPAHQQQHQH